MPQHSLPAVKIAEYTSAGHGSVNMVKIQNTGKTENKRNSKKTRHKPTRSQESSQVTTRYTTRAKRFYNIVRGT